jgi:hypothetical protein
VVDDQRRVGLRRRRLRCGRDRVAYLRGRRHLLREGHGHRSVRQRRHSTGTINIAPAPGSPGPTDADHDGDPAGSDCNDNDPAVHHGAVDIPGNGVNEDCVGGDATVILDVRFTDKWTVFKNYTTVFALAARRVPAGGKVVVTCKGRGCNFKKQTISAKKPGDVTLTKYFNFKKKGKGVVSHLKPGAKVTILVTKPGTIGAFLESTIQKQTSKYPKKVSFPKDKSGCVAVNSTSRITCPKSTTR